MYLEYPLHDTEQFKPRMGFGSSSSSPQGLRTLPPGRNSWACLFISDVPRLQLRGVPRYRQAMAHKAALEARGDRPSRDQLIYYDELKADLTPDEVPRGGPRFPEEDREIVQENPRFSRR